jgi:hypothetical protein
LGQNFEFEQICPISSFDWRRPGASAGAEMGQNFEFEQICPISLTAPGNGSEQNTAEEQLSQSQGKNLSPFNN